MGNNYFMGRCSRVVSAVENKVKVVQFHSFCTQYALKGKLQEQEYISVLTRILYTLRNTSK
jgi:hypothetical protein